MQTEIEHNADVTDIYLFAINSGELYPLHRRLAATAAPAHIWVEHVRTTVKRLYRTQVDRAAPPFCGPAVVEAAAELAAYYRDRLAEETRFRLVSE